LFRVYLIICILTSQVSYGQTLVFIRHGQTDWHHNMIPLGEQDLGLNQQGAAQIESIICIIEPIINSKKVVILTSPLKRAMETAQIITSSISSIEVELTSLPFLTERSFHEPKVQTDSDFYTQSTQAALKIRSYMHKYQSVIVVSHKHMIKILAKQLCNADNINLNWGGIYSCSFSYE